MEKNIINKAFLILFAVPSVAVAQEHKLPVLNYQYIDLEPFIDATTMEIHYSKHHQAYVNNLNKALENTEAANLNIEDLMLNVSKYGPAVRNNGGGHYNHSLYWSILSPKPQNEPSGNLSEMIIANFGSVEELKKQMNQAGASRFGSGWAWLVLTKDMKLVVSSTPNQDNPLMDVADVRGIPLIGIDVWEHAYYLKYQNKRPDYLDAIWNLIDWKKVEENFENAQNSHLFEKM
ncbi:MAG: superoxide dismutase [Bacteroidales bacterium]|nr:superoxide dismutase [Bacteroidales bacterium]